MLADKLYPGTAQSLQSLGCCFDNGIQLIFGGFIYPFIGIFTDDGKILHHNMAGQPSDTDSDEMLYGLNRVVLCFQFILQGRQSLIPKIIVQTLVHR